MAVVKTDNGRGVEVAGDSILALFDRPRDALRAAVGIRDALRAEPWPLDLTPPEVRLAVHSGRVADPTARAFGSAAMTCASLCAAGELSWKASCAS